MLGFDILHNRNRITYGINSDFDLRTFGQTEPYFFSFSFRAGYQWLKSTRLQLRTLGGLGCTYVFVRFENETPRSLQNIAPNYSDPFARASTFITRWEVLASWEILSRPQRKLLYFQPLVIFNAGVQPVLDHGRWVFGEMEPDVIDGNRFVGQRIEMPSFHKANWFIEVGMALSITARNNPY